MSFGEELKRERELREISLREISVSTKISLRYLEALERNEFGSLPGGVFNRGFVRAYAQFIGVDPNTMVDAYMLEERSRSVDDASARDRSRGADSIVRRFVWVWILLGLIVIASASYFAWTRWSAPDDPVTSSESVGSESPEISE